METDNPVEKDIMEAGKWITENPIPKTVLSTLQLCLLVCARISVVSPRLLSIILASINEDLKKMDDQATAKEKERGH